MQVRAKGSIRVLADGADLLPPLHRRAAFDLQRLQMRVERANPPLLVVFVKDMFDDDDVPPRLAALFGKNDAPLRDGKDRLAQIGVAAAAPVPIFAGMQTQAVFFAKARGAVPALMRLAGGLVGVSALAVGVAEGEIEAVGGGDVGLEKIVEGVAGGVSNKGLACLGWRLQGRGWV